MTHPVPAPTGTPLQRRADPATWDLAKADYARGVPPRLIAERHGLGERNIRRRAVEEDWPRRLAQLREPDAETLAELEPLIDGLANERREELSDLLLRPRPRNLLRYAFQRATEAAVMSRPQEMLHWLRAVDHLRRSCEDVERINARYDPCDVLRASYADETRPDLDAFWREDADDEERARLPDESDSADSAASAPDSPAWPSLV